MERHYVTTDGTVNEHTGVFGPLATSEAAFDVRAVIEKVEGHNRLWVVQDDDHLLTYRRSLLVPNSPVHIEDAARA